MKRTIYTTKEVCKMFGINAHTAYDLYTKFLKKEKFGFQYMFTNNDIKKLKDIFKE